jgi:hypothetical protein
MPDFRYAGPGTRTYPETRDRYGVLVGTVEPGDVLELDEAPDQWWVPYVGGEDQSAPAGASGGDAPESADPPAVTP